MKGSWFQSFSRSCCYIHLRVEPTVEAEILNLLVISAIEKPFLLILKMLIRLADCECFLELKLHEI